MPTDRTRWPEFLSPLLLAAAFIALRATQPLPCFLRALEAALAFVFLREATGQPSASAVAVLALSIFPSPPFQAQIVSRLLVLASMTLHIRWQVSRRVLWLVLAQAAYFLAVRTSPAGAALPLLLLAVNFHHGGLKRWKETAYFCAPYAVTLALALAGRRLGGNFPGPIVAEVSLGTFGPWRRGAFFAWAAASALTADRCLLGDRDKPKTIWLWLLLSGLFTTMPR